PIEKEINRNGQFNRVASSFAHHAESAAAHRHIDQPVHVQSAPGIAANSVVKRRRAPLTPDAFGAESRGNVLGGAPRPPRSLSSSSPIRQRRYGADGVPRTTATDMNTEHASRVPSANV